LAVVPMRLRDWAKAHRSKALGYLLWIAFDFTAAAALGALLVWGPLNRGWSPLNLLAAAILGSVGAALRGRHLMAEVVGPRVVARKWGMWLNGVQALLFVGIGALCLVQLYAIGTLPPITQDKLANFERLTRAIEANYPYFDLKEIQWETIRERYEERIERVEDDEEYFRVIAMMLAELGDAHSGVLSPRLQEPGEFLGLVRKLEGKAVVTAVRPTLGIPELTRGTVILERDGAPVEEYLRGLDPWLVAGSTPAQREFLAYMQLLRIPSDRPVQYVVETPTGEIRELVLRWQESYRNAGQATPRAPVSGEVLPSGVGLIEIRTFRSGTGVVDLFDRALEEVFDTPGLIIDLRGNGGGSTLVSDSVAGRFFEDDFLYGIVEFRERLPITGWAKRLPLKVRPRGETYRGRVAILTDVSNMSTAELFIVAMKDSGRAITVGTQTAGASGNPVTFNLPGGRVRFSTGFFRRSDGTPIEGRGISPDIPVEPTIEDIRQGRDPALERAVRYILEGTL